MQEKLLYKYTVLINTTIASFMALLDSTIVLIALPSIVRDLPGTSTFLAIWVIMGYTLITATFLLSFGRLADIFGRVKIYNAGFAIFTIGSALCSVSWSGIALVLFRLVQGTGSALIFSNSAAIITDAFPVTERGRALGINQVSAATGSVLGLVLGGILTALLTWRSIFWVNIPFGVFATIWAHQKLKETSKLAKGQKLDPLGNGLFASGLTLLLLGVTFGALSGWTENLAILAAVAGVLLITVFVFVERRVLSPMTDFSLLKLRTFSAGIFANLLAALARGAFSLVLVFYFQGPLGLDALTAGVLLVPFSIAFVSSGPISGYLSDRYGARGFTTSGLLISAVAFLWFATIPAFAPYDLLVIPMVLTGLGGGMFIAPNISSVMSSVPVDRRGVASGMSSMFFNTGFVLSIAIAFTFMSANVPLSVLQEIFAGNKVSSTQINAGLFVSSMHNIFLLSAAISIAAVFAIVLSGRRLGRGFASSSPRRENVS